MAIVPYDPFHGLDRMRNYIDQIFPDSIYPFDFKKNTLPTMDLHETADAVIATCDLPGLNSKEDVDIDIESTLLTIKGAVKQSQEFNENQVRHRERFVGGFQRSITLPCPVNESEAKATYKNGVLEIRMPKLTNPNRKRIDVDFH